MERDKIIEEMTTNGLCCIACVMCDETLENGKFVKAECLESGCTNNCSISRHVAEAFIDAGYRKIPDGAVVLTKEECEKIQRQLDFYLMRIRQYEQEEVDREIMAFKKLEGKRTLYKENEIETIKEQVRKETAMEILQKIWENSTSYDEYFDANGEECLGITWEGLAREEFEKIKEKYGVEVE